MAQAHDVLTSSARAADVIDDDRPMFGQGCRIDEHDRQPGAIDLLHLGVPVGQPDRDDAIDGRADHRGGEAAVERRDEVEGVCRSSATSATPSLNAPKNGLLKITLSACGVSTPMVIVWRCVSIRATGCGR